MIILNNPSKGGGTSAAVTTGTLSGTADQVIVTGGTDSMLYPTVLSLPQSIGTASNVTFGTATLNGLVIKAGGWLIMDGA
jgi:hypothetical protein